MQFLFDILPIILFFIVYKFAGIFYATGAAIGVSVLQALWSWYRNGKVDKTIQITLVILVVLGGLTIFLGNPIFFMWKPTLVNWILALAFLGSQFIGSRPLIQRALEEKIQLPPAIWYRISTMWAVFFLLLGGINLWVVYDYSGFYGAYHTLLAATGLPHVNLSNCQTLFSGQQLALCEAAHHSETSWVNFKLFGILGITFCFVILQGVYLSRHLVDTSGEQAPS